MLHKYCGEGEYCVPRFDFSNKDRDGFPGPPWAGSKPWPSTREEPEIMDVVRRFTGVKANALGLDPGDVAMDS